VLGLIRESRRFFLSVTLAGLALRLLFFFYYPAVTDDSRIYADLATNWLQHGVYGQTPGGSAQATKIMPVDTRLPGYPAFLALIFCVFGPGNFKAVMLAQILIDLGTCVIVADFARRAISARASRIAFVLAALCPFLANYCAAVLTETLEVFFTALALDCAATALERMEALPIVDKERSSGRFLWASTGLAIAACILLRPDGGLLLAAVLLYLVLLFLVLLDLSVEIWKRRAGRRNPAGVAVAGFVVLVCALAPLAPWTIRNLHTLHHFQPLVPRYANDRDEFVPRGFNRWVKTWMADYVSVEEIYWNVPGDKIDASKLPARAFDNAAEQIATVALIADYNEDQDMTPELDARFGELAAERIRAHPLRYYVALPLLRIADMWLRPRTALLPCDPRWWEFNDDPKMSALAVGFGLLNLAYVAAALAALVSRHSIIRWLGLLGIFLVLRSAFLGTLENPEPRYTLECYPVIVVLAAAWLARVGASQLRCGAVNL
jgi:4-amino-4-deoxy-L-arabinose transferase-like glycosyltransferase